VNVADFYEALGVRRDATNAEIRSAYLKLARDRHPDRFTDAAEKAQAEERFKEITTAFNALSNEKSRREYDAELNRPRLTTPEALAAEAYAQGTERFKARDFHEAVNFFRIAVHHLPERAEYHLALGRTLALNPNWSREAVAALEEAARLDPRNARIHAELACVLGAQGLRIRAQRSAETAHRLAPNDQEIMRMISEIGFRSEGGDAIARGAGIIDRLRGRS
jgi:curved DNA-binding protein CbpA